MRSHTDSQNQNPIFLTSVKGVRIVPLFTLLTPVYSIPVHFVPKDVIRASNPSEGPPSLRHRVYTLLLILILLTLLFLSPKVTHVVVLGPGCHSLMSEEPKDVPTSPVFASLSTQPLPVIRPVSPGTCHPTSQTKPRFY